MLLRLPARPILKIQKFPLFYVDSFGKTFLILYPSLENSTTPIAITQVQQSPTCNWREFLSPCFGRKYHKERLDFCFRFFFSFITYAQCKY